jgi:hypothetical protein
VKVESPGTFLSACPYSAFRLNVGTKGENSLSEIRTEIASERLVRC